MIGAKNRRQNLGVSIYLSFQIQNHLDKARDSVKEQLRICELTCLSRGSNPMVFLRHGLIL